MSSLDMPRKKIPCGKASVAIRSGHLILSSGNKVTDDSVVS